MKKSLKKIKNTFLIESSLDWDKVKFVYKTSFSPYLSWFKIIMLAEKTRENKKKLRKEQGQVIVEYILLLVVSTTMALALIQMVNLDPAKQSPVFKYWSSILKKVGADDSTK